MGRDQEALELVAGFPPGHVTYEVALLRETSSQLGACATRAENDGSLSAADREARISNCAQLAAASCARLRDCGFVSWEKVWALPELEPFRNRDEIPEECRSQLAGGAASGS